MNNQCPRCRQPLHATSARNALSRLDNQTYICTSCGTSEAMYNLAHPGEPLPPFDQPLFG